MPLNPEELSNNQYNYVYNYVIRVLMNEFQMREAVFGSRSISLRHVLITGAQMPG